MEHNRCETCEHARKACSDGVVVCSLLQTIAWENDMTNQEFVSSSLFKEKLTYLAEGWGYLQCRPEWETDGVFGRGIMTNHVLLTKKDAYCSQYESARNYSKQ